jgi:hypothetical protein
MKQLFRAGSLLDRTFRLVLYDALASEVMGTLTTGVFLVGYAVGLGAGNVAIGVQRCRFAVQFLQLPAGRPGRAPAAGRAIATWAAGSVPRSGSPIRAPVTCGRRSQTKWSGAI